MTANKRAIATDLKRLDAHVVQPEEYEDAPELTDAQLDTATLQVGGQPVRRGRPRSPARKLAVKLRFDPEVIRALRQSGPGWQTRVNVLLLQAVVGKNKAAARTLLIPAARKRATTKRRQQRAKA
jgi:uncharacterized protein (DUF4415 family)